MIFPGWQKACHFVFQLLLYFPNTTPLVRAKKLEQKTLPNEFIEVDLNFVVVIVGCAQLLRL